MLQSRLHSLFITAFAALLASSLNAQDVAEHDGAKTKRPNILLAISDDQSYPYASAYGTPSIFTPAFDRVAREGVLFTAAFTASPGCSPSRASLLTGRYPWQNEHAGTHDSLFPAKFATYPRLLAAAGYHVGHTGKGWGPGKYRAGGFKTNPAGPGYQVNAKETPNAIRRTDYASSFAKFLSERKPGQPFCFWYGSSEPHRPYSPGIGQAHGGDAAAVTVPAFLPDTPEVRQDLLDYEYEIAWFDRHLGRMLHQLESIGELDNTIVVVTSDNGMAFPRAKANCYEYGIHMPLAIRWPTNCPGGRTVSDLVSLVDLMPTFLQAAQVAHNGPHSMAGRSLMPILRSKQSGSIDPSRSAVYSGRERHSSSRWHNLAYPQRCIRTAEYLYIRNYRPERWPAGAPEIGIGNRSAGNADSLKPGPRHAAYHDIDACPTMRLLRAGADSTELGQYLQLAVAHRPAEELFNIKDDPACLHNLAGNPKHEEARADLATRLQKYLRQTRDPRELDGGEVFESYKRYGRMRRFPRPDWAEGIAP